MTRLALIAAAVALAGATPMFAAGECVYLGTPSSQGALICQAGTISQCKAGRWLPTKKTCKVETTIAHKAAVVAPPPVAALSPPAASLSPAPIPPTSIVAPPPAQPPAPRYLLHILTASYSAGNSGVDVSYRLRDVCEGKPACSFVGDVKFLQGDPAPREKGRFSIKYACTTGFQSQDARHDVFAKNATILLNCQP